MFRFLKIKILIIFTLFNIYSVTAETIVRMETTLGNIDIELRPDVAPNTVANFLNYVNDGSFNNSFIHRTIPNFIIQGGSFAISNEEAVSIPVNDPVANEFNLSNSRGTIAMAKLPNNPDSATSGWFINVGDNNSGTANEGNLDLQNGGFTAFGSVINGMDIVDIIATSTTVNAGGAFTTLPVINYPGSGPAIPYLIMITSVTIIEQEFNINSGLNGAWYNPETSGSGIMIEILPTSELAFLAWFTWDTELPASELTSIIGNPGQRWLTGLGSIDHDAKTITFDLTNTSGGLFDNEMDVVNSATGTVGSVVLGFSDCENATLTFNMIDSELTNTRNLIRISSENTALCTQLSSTVTIQ